MKCQVGLLLLGNSVLYGLKGQPRPSLEVGGVKVDHMPHYESAVRALLDDGVIVYAQREALERLSIEPHRMLESIVAVAAGQLAEVVGSYDKVWYW